MKNLSRALAVLLIIAATFLVYWPAVRNGFVELVFGKSVYENPHGFVWDDTALVLRDPLIRSWRLIPEGFRHFLFLDATAANFYRPIQRLTFVADYQFFGFGRPGAWHLTSVLIHTGAAVALFFLAEKLIAIATGARAGRDSRSLPANHTNDANEEKTHAIDSRANSPSPLGERARIYWALGIALLWAIHPLHTSAVTYVAGRADPLAALFGVTGLALGLASLDATRRVWLWRLGAAGGLALAILSKESGGTFLLVWLLVLLWRRVTGRALVAWIGLLALVVGCYCGLRFTAHKVPPPAAPPTPVAVRPILAARALLEYGGLIVAPITLRMERDVSTTPKETYADTMRNARLREFETLGGVLLFLGLVAWARFAWRHAPVAAFCLGAAALAYIPISNAFPLNATIAEHWLYVPSAFLFTAIALTALALAQKPGDQTDQTPFQSLCASAPLRLILTASIISWALILGARSYLRQDDWRDQRTFVERTISAGGQSARMLANLANVEFGAGKRELAVQLYREALRRAPEQPIIWMGYASVLTAAGDVPGAREALTHTEGSPLLRSDVLQLRASLALRDGNGDPLALLREAAEATPANWPIRKRYIEVLAERGELAEARLQIAAFLKVYPFRADSWKLFGQILERTNEPDLARAAYAEAALRDVRFGEVVKAGGPADSRQK